MAKVKPITPKEVSKVRDDTFPDEVIEVFNDLIVKNWDGSEATVYQKEAIKEITKRTNFTSSYIFDKHFMDVEGMFKKAGWKVTYDRPCIDEDFESYYRFKKK